MAESVDMAPLGVAVGGGEGILLIDAIVTMP